MANSVPFGYWGSFVLLPLWCLVPNCEKVGKIRTFLIRRGKNLAASEVSGKMMSKTKKKGPKKPTDFVCGEAPSGTSLVVVVVVAAAAVVVAFQPPIIDSRR